MSTAWVPIDPVEPSRTTWRGELTGPFSPAPARGPEPVRAAGLCGAGRGLRGASGRFLADRYGLADAVPAVDPTQRAGRPPVPPAEQPHGRRYEQGADPRHEI